jgi:hypothetical protein
MTEQNQETLINRVAASPLKSYDLEELMNTLTQAAFDLSDCLYQGVIIREKEFREYIKNHDWHQYEGKWVKVFCSTDAIVPMWAYMLIGTKLNGIAGGYVFGNDADLERAMLSHLLSREAEKLKDAKVVVKGCSALSSPEYAFMEVSRHFGPVVASLMYGEPCSTVPIYKAPKKK